MSVRTAPSRGSASERPAPPRLRDVLRRVAFSLVIACVVPAAVFYTAFRGYGIWTAIFAALAWSYGAIAWRALTGRRTSGLLILTAAVMTGRTLVALLTDSTFLYFLQPIITDGLIGALFLASVLTARPMVARLAGDFYPMDEELAVRPGIRRLFRTLTLMWASLCLAKAGMTLWLLLSQSLETFVLVKSVSVLAINGVAVLATIGLAVLVGRREGLLHPVPTAVPLPVPATV
jgi:intracellular septation protein A